MPFANHSSWNGNIIELVDPSSIGSSILLFPVHFSGPQNADFTCTEANVQRTCATFGKTCVGMVKYPNATVDEYGNWDNINILPMTDPWGWCIYI